MTAPLHFESILPSAFDASVKIFKSGSKEIAHNLLMNLIFTLKTQNQEVLKLKSDVELKDSSLAFSLDTEEFHDSMIQVSDTLYELEKTTKEFENKSDIFKEFYKIVDELYTNSLQLAYCVSSIASEKRYLESKLAS